MTHECDWGECEQGIWCEWDGGVVGVMYHMDGMDGGWYYQTEPYKQGYISTEGQYSVSYFPDITMQYLFYYTEPNTRMVKYRLSHMIHDIQRL